MKITDLALKIFLVWFVRLAWKHIGNDYLFQYNNHKILIEILNSSIIKIIFGVCEILF